MPSDPNKVRDVFLAAVELPPEQRSSYVADACGPDIALLAEVEQLLTAHADPNSLLEPPSPTPTHAAGTLFPDDRGTVDLPSDTSLTGTFSPADHRPKSIATGEGDPERPTVTYDATPISRERHIPIDLGSVIAGRYTLVETIGEGGMGLVYLSSQTEPVKRQVALKLIKAGMDSKAVLARFDAERQALALMDHPNIARIYDGGITPSGQPFFVMELVRGVPLTLYCDQKRLSVKGRLELFVSVCQAVQHAHQKGIIHRDLKPANVLVIEVDGRPTPKVIDFGVAKATEQKLTEMSFSDVGAIVGTPAYMSPEQADPSSMDIDTRTDVYALGVMLYELLTGSPPIEASKFKRGAILEMLRMVREVDPLRPSTKLSTADALPNIAANRNIEPAKLSKLLQGELDWVVMKAIEKDRTQRYDTANGLARDIQRYLADEVVEARPPSARYRLKKFVTRNRVQVTAAAAVVLALVWGVIGTTLALVEAQHQEAKAKEQEGYARNEADEKEIQRKKAVAASDDAIAARNEAIAARNDLEKSNDQLLSGVARSLLRSLAVQVNPNQILPPLNPQELEPLWDLAASNDDRLRLRIVEVASHDAILAQRLRYRAPFAIHAAVGLDPKRRARVEALLGEQLQAPGTSAEQQEQAALCLVQLGVRDRTLARKTAATLTQALTKATYPLTARSLTSDLFAVAARMEPNEAAATFTRAMTTTTSPAALHSLADALAVVAARMEPNEAAAALTRAITATDEPFALHALARGLTAVADRMEPWDSARACAAAAAHLARAIKTESWFALEPLTQGMSVVAARLEPKDAAEAAATLTHVMTKNAPHPSALLNLTRCLSEVAARMEPKGAAAILMPAISTTTDPIALYTLGQCLSEVAARMEPKDAAATAVALNQTMTTTNPDALAALVQGLAAVAAQMEPEDAARVCAQAAVTLTQAATTAASPDALHTLAQRLRTVTGRLEPKDAAQLCGPFAAKLVQALTTTKTTDALRPLAQGLSEVAIRLEPKDAAGAAARLLQAIINPSTHPTAGQFLALGLSAVAARLEPKDAAEIAAKLVQAIAPSTHPIAVQYLSESLSAVVARLEPKDAAAALTQAVSTTKEPNALRSLAHGLSAVVARLEPKDAAATLTLVTTTTDPNALAALVSGLSAVMARLEPKDAAGLAAALVRAMANTKEQRVLRSLAWSLSAVAVRMEPKEAVGTLIPAISTTTDSTVLVALTRGLSSLAARLEPENAADLVAKLTRFMAATTDPTAVREMAVGLSAVVPRLDPKDAAQVCGQAAATLTQAMTTNARAVGPLAQGLTAVTARMEPTAGAQVCAESAALLTRIMTTATAIDMFTLETLAEGLSAVTARMDPHEAALVCGPAAAKLTQTITASSIVSRTLVDGLSAVLCREPPTTTRQRLQRICTLLSGFGGPCLTFAIHGLQPLALEPPPRPLPAQTLVDLLKHPFCIGEPRRLLLVQLSRYYHRPFADQWEFVEYVTDNKLPLDLTTPPVRPQQP